MFFHKLPMNYRASVDDIHHHLVLDNIVTQRSLEVTEVSPKKRFPIEFCFASEEQT